VYLCRMITRITQALSGLLTRWQGTNRVVITIPLEAYNFHTCHVAWADNELKIVGHITTPHDASSTEHGIDQSRMDASCCHQIS